MPDSIKKKQTLATTAMFDRIMQARVAQRKWAQELPRVRLHAIGKVASQIADHAQEFVARSPRPNASPAEVIASELLPLADACRYAARIGRRALASKTHSLRYGAWWMGRISVRVQREPWGVVLILAPSNYPLFLPGVQIVQALAAGNAILVKPAVGCEAILARFIECLQAVGIPSDLVQLLDSSVTAGQAAMAAGVDKVLLTGSAESGREVLEQASHTLTPTVMELSGCDAVFVTDRADLGRVARCLAYALRLNGGATCIAPRRVFVLPHHVEPLCELLRSELDSGTSREDQSEANAARAEYTVPFAAVKKIVVAAEQALQAGAEVFYGALPIVPLDLSGNVLMRPLVLHHVTPHMEIAKLDLFGPVMSLLTVADMQAAIAADRLCPYRLGASLFGPSNHAAHWGSQLDVGCVVINDIIVPTADPRVSFGGSGESGWGVTRGWEGLLDMTRPKTICVRRGRWLPHLDAQLVGNVLVMHDLLQMWHSSGWRSKWAALRRLMRSRGKG